MLPSAPCKWDFFKLSSNCKCKLFIILLLYVKPEEGRGGENTKFLSTGTVSLVRATKIDQCTFHLLQCTELWSHTVNLNLLLLPIQAKYFFKIIHLQTATSAIYTLSHHTKLTKLDNSYSYPDPDKKAHTHITNTQKYPPSHTCQNCC